MIYFSLPNLYNHNRLLTNICNLQKRHMEMLKVPVQFVSMYEQLPFCYLCGGVNYNKDHILAYADLQSTSSTKISHLAKRLNFSNLFLQEDDLTDEYFKIVLQAYSNNKSNWIEISNIPVAIKLKEQNVQFELIFSQDADVLYPFTEDNLNTIIEQDLFKLISLPWYKTNLDLSKINDRSKLELTVNNTCPNCSYTCQRSCIEKEHAAIYNYSNHSILLNCEKHPRYTDPKSLNISLEDIKNIYLPLGIKHYKLNHFPDEPQAFIDFIFFFVNYFIKEEYQQHILSRLLKENLYYD